MTEPISFFDRVLAILRRRALPILLLLLCGEAAIWLSGKGSLGIMLLLVVLTLTAAVLGAMVRALRDAGKS